MNDLRLGSPMITSKMDGKPISIEDAIALKILLLGSACKPFPNGWIGKSNIKGAFLVFNHLNRLV